MSDSRVSHDKPSWTEGKGTASRKRSEMLFKGIALFSIILPLLILSLLMASVFVQALPKLSFGFLSAFPSRKAELSGVYPALVGTLWLMVLTAAFALPVGISAAIYLEEYAKKNRMARVFETQIANLAGVPSIVYGLLGLFFFVRTLGLGRSVLSGALTLSLLVMPIVVVSSREALRTVPMSLREAALALGASRFAVLRHVVLPAALPGILTGAILALSRAVGETAPIVIVGAVTFMTFVPNGPMSDFAALPIQIFNWVSRPQAGFAATAAAGIVVLLAVLLIMNAGAIILRDRLQRGRR